MGAEHLKPLTSLRFIAAMWVVLFHWWPKADFGPMPAFVEKGYLGVELFFILSGFILCHVYLDQAGEGRFRYGGFLWNRLARVFPLHLFTTVGVGLLAGAALLAGLAVDGNVLHWESLPANLLMVHAWGVTDTAGWNHPSWSISAEWFAYLTFPIFAALAWGLRNRPLVAAGLGIAALFGGYALYRALTGMELTLATFAGGAFRIVPPFAFGCAVFLLWRSGVVADARRALAVLFASLGGVLAATSSGAPDALTVTFLGGLILGLAGLSSTARNPLSAAPLVYLGEVSYSVYMICIPWQLVAVNGAQKLLGTEALPLWAWLPLVLAIPALAAGSYHLVERPARRLMRAFAARRRGEGEAVQIA